MHNHASIDMFGEPVPAETIVNPLDLLDSIVSAAEADIYTDAPECAGQVALMSILVAKARTILPPPPVDVAEAQVSRALEALKALGHDQPDGCDVIDESMPMAHHRYILVEIDDIDQTWLSAHPSPNAALRFNLCEEPEAWNVVGLWDVAAGRWYSGQASLTEMFEPPAQDSSDAAQNPS